MDNLKSHKKCNSINMQKQKLHMLKKKKECEKKALNIVIELVDGGLEEDDLLYKLRSINVCHYEDVVEERFILKQCGYVLCNQQLTNILKQQYIISAVKKKVFDITERKKFCSDSCYKRSNYIQSQLLTSPLWLRDIEVVPKFKLLKTDLKNSTENIFNTEIIKSEKELNVII